jgi:MraZ protein
MYEVRGSGETLREIAERTLNSPERWKEIEELNPEMRAHMKVPSGWVLRLPADARVVRTASAEEVVPVKPAEMPGVPGVRSKVPEFVRPSPQPKFPAQKETQASRPRTFATLTGTYPASMDRHSLSLPKEVWQQLDQTETLFVTPGPDGCLWIVNQGRVEKLIERVEQGPAHDNDFRAYRRLYFAQTEKSEVDDAGKTVLSAKMMEYAGLGKEVVLVGIDDHFELWDAQRWQQYSQQKASPGKSPTRESSRDLDIPQQ